MFSVPSPRLKWRRKQQGCLNTPRMVVTRMDITKSDFRWRTATEFAFFRVVRKESKIFGPSHDPPLVNFCRVANDEMRLRKLFPAIGTHIILYFLAIWNPCFKRLFKSVSRDKIFKDTRSISAALFNGFYARIILYTSYIP